MPPGAYTAPPAVRRAGRERVDQRGREGTRPLLIVWIAWLVLMTGVNLATPLYAVYAERFGFSSLVLTAIFVAYALALLPALLLFGCPTTSDGGRSCWRDWPRPVPGWSSSRPLRAPRGGCLPVCFRVSRSG